MQWVFWGDFLWVSFAFDYFSIWEIYILRVRLVAHAAIVWFGAFHTVLGVRVGITEARSYLKK